MGAWVVVSRLGIATGARPSRATEESRLLLGAARAVEVPVRELLALAVLLSPVLEAKVVKRRVAVFAAMPDTATERRRVVEEQATGLDAKCAERARRDLRDRV